MAIYRPSDLKSGKALTSLFTTGVKLFLSLPNDADTQSLLERIEGFDESRIIDIIDDTEALMDMAPECTGFMVIPLAKTG